MSAARAFALDQRSSSPPNPVGEYFFDQLLDHTNPSLGTFKQRYFFSAQYYGGQGSPIILATPGEQSIDGFQPELNGPTLQYAMMQVFGAAGIILERQYLPQGYIYLSPAERCVLDRYWGQSSPYTNLTTQNLRYLTVTQAISDLKV